MHLQDRHNQRYGQGHGDDGRRARAHPHDKYRPQGGLGQRVEHHQVRIQNAREHGAPPQQNGNHRARQRAQGKADHRFQARCAQMPEQLARSIQVFQRFPDARWAAHDKIVNPALLRGDFPQREKADQQSQLGQQHPALLPLAAAQIGRALYGMRLLRHLAPAPSKLR